MGSTLLAALVAAVFLNCFHLADSGLLGSLLNNGNKNKDPLGLNLNLGLGNKDTSTANKDPLGLNLNLGLSNKDTSTANKDPLGLNLNLGNKDTSSGNKDPLGLNLNLGLGNKDTSTANKDPLGLNLNLGNKDTSSGNKDPLGLNLNLGLGNKDTSTANKDPLGLNLNLGNKDTSSANKDPLGLNLNLGNKDTSSGNKDPLGLNLNLGLGNKDTSTANKDPFGLNLDLGNKGTSSGYKDPFGLNLDLGNKDKSSGNKDPLGLNLDLGFGNKDTSSGYKDPLNLNLDLGNKDISSIIKDPLGLNLDLGLGNKDKTTGYKDPLGLNLDLGLGNKDKSGNKDSLEDYLDKLLNTDSLDETLDKLLNKKTYNLEADLDKLLGNGKWNLDWKLDSDSKKSSLNTDDLLDLLKSTKHANKDSASLNDLLNFIWGSAFGGKEFQSGKPCSICGQSSPEYTALKTESLLHLKECDICKELKGGKKSISEAVIKQSENGPVTKDLEDTIDELLKFGDNDLPREKKRPILLSLLGLHGNFALPSFDWNGVIGDHDSTFQDLFNKIKGSNLNVDITKSILDLLNIRLDINGNLNLNWDWNLNLGLGKSCYNLNLSSSSDDRTYQKIGLGFRKVTDISINIESSQNVCEAGKSYGYDGGRVFISGGCSGNFKVCYNLDNQKQLEQLGTGRLNCGGIFSEIAGHCVSLETKYYKDYFDAAAACAAKGARLVQLKDANTFLGVLSTPSYLKGYSFHFGGFLDLDLAPSSFFINLGFKINTEEEEVRLSSRRFGRDRENYKSAWNSASAVASRCPRIDLGSKTNTLASCSEKLGYICEKIDKDNTKDARWSDWYSFSNNGTDGDEETLDDLIDAASNGQLGADIRLGRYPIDMQCQEVGTNKLYSKENTYGLVLRSPCERNTITCYNSEQRNGQRCPNFSTRFLFPVNELDDCALDAVRKKCERTGKRCVNTVFGTKCEKIPTPRTGSEDDDGDYSIVEGQKYKKLECSSKGGIHHSTFDNAKADIQISGGINLIGTSSSFIVTDIFPEFSLNAFFNDFDSTDEASTVAALDLTIDGSIYSFTDNSIFVNGVQRPALGFDDGVIGVTTFRTGESTQLNIGTNFGARFKWNSKNGIRITVPDYFRRNLFGFCGNADSDPEDDFTISGSGDDRDLTAYAKYHAVGSVAGKVAEHKSRIPRDVSPEDVTKFSDPSFCGILSADRLFGQRLLTLAGPLQDTIRSIFSDNLFNCIQDHSSLNSRSINRCGRISYDITRSIDFFRFSNTSLVGELDRLWRSLSGCESTNCGPNQVYNPVFIPTRQRSIANLFAYITSEDDSTTGGCQCKEGFVLDKNLACIPKKEVANTCLVELSARKPTPLKNGETIVIQPCQKVAQCVNGSVEESSLEACSDNAECSKDGLKCICLPGFEGDGKTCYLNNKCRKGFYNFGTKCYRVTEDKLTFSEASGVCDLLGSHLAGADDDDSLWLERFLQHIESPEALAASKAKPVSVYCPFGGKCKMQRDKKIVDCKSRTQTSTCSNPFEITLDRLSVKSGSCGDGNLLCDVIDDLFSTGTKTYRRFLIRGNTNILPADTKIKSCRCNLQLPRQLDLAGLNGLSGCFHTGLGLDNKLTISPAMNCEEKVHAICEYDNTNINTFDPLDIKVLDKAVNNTEAARLCQLEDRPLAVINNTAIRDKAKSALLSLGFQSGWHDYQRDLNTDEFKCGICKLSKFDNWDFTSLTFDTGKEYQCSSISALSGKFSKEKCNAQLYPICGPRLGKSEPAFTQAFPCGGITSLDSLIAKLKRDGSEEYVCSSPPSVECTAQKYDGEHITVGTHNIGTHSAGAITCNTTTISCTSGMGVKCETCKARFLCIAEVNECKELAKRGKNPCIGGQICVPTQNGFWCRCPTNYVFNNETKMCERYNPSCVLGLGPTLKPYNGKEFSFSSNCKHKLLGPPDDVWYTSMFQPHFNIYSYHKPCLNSSENCISKVLLELKNFQRYRCTCKGTEDFNIEIDIKADKYLINNKAYTKSMTESDFFSVEFRPKYFSILVQKFGLTLTINEGLLKTSTPESSNDKFDGLCIGSPTNSWRLKDGSQLDLGFGSAGFGKSLTRYLKSWVFEEEGSPKCDDPKPVDPVVTDECAKDALWQQSAFCNVFLSINSTLHNAFLETNLDRNYYFEKCRAEVCRTRKPQDAECAVARLFASDCAERNLFLQWRTPTFCHYDCGDEVYDIDASNEPACGVNPVFKRSSEHRAEEGCRCAPGFKRLNGKCVPENKCGCSTGKLDNVFLAALAINESVYGPGCLEKDTCVAYSDGTTKLEHTFTVLPPNSRCSSSVPFTVECIEGYRWAVDRSACVAVPNECEEGFENIFGQCVAVSPQPMSWRDWVDSCNAKDATFIDSDQPRNQELIEKLLQQSNAGCIFAAGQVIVDKKDKKDEFSFRSCLTDNEHKEKGWANYKSPKSLLGNLQLHQSISAADVANGSGLRIAFSLVGAKAQAFAVLPNTQCGSICVFRNSSQDDLEYLDPCGTDDVMEDDGDSESSADLLLNPACKICPRPKGIQCVPNPNSRNNGTVSGDCRFSQRRASYECLSGVLCQDKLLSILCDKDVDECATGRGLCGPNSKCINTVGNYRCECNEDYPVSVNGVCQKSHTCSATTYTDNDDLVYNFIGFDGIPGIFNLNCKFKLFTLSSEAFESLSSGKNVDAIPFISVYALSRFQGGRREPVIAGYQVNPATGDEFHFEISRGHLLNGKILAGRNANALKLTSALRTKDPVAGIEISSFQVGTVKIADTKKHYSLELSLTGPLLKIVLSVTAYDQDSLRGVCASTPYKSEDAYDFNEEEIDEISVEAYAKCRKPISTGLLTTPAPIDNPSTSPASPVTPSSSPSTPSVDETCDVSFTSFCTLINQLLSIPEAKCQKRLCGGKISKCAYLTLETFRVQGTVPEIKALLGRECRDFCSPNQHLKLISKAARPTCATRHLSFSSNDNQINDLIFACTCNDGLLFTGTECVPESLCGCVIEEKQYWNISEEWRSDDCSIINTCRGNQVVESREAPCGPNTLCVFTEQGPTCECQSGYYGNAQCKEGCAEGWQEGNGSKICYNYSFCNGRTEVRCDCQSGYISNCDDCEDIDECKEGLHECNSTIHSCVNRLGGYSCECHPGYKERNGKCVDIDECNTNQHNCSQNQGCVNRKGSFKCKCCAGYKKGNNPSECERDTQSFPVLPSDAQCCLTCPNYKLCSQTDRITYCYSPANGERKEYSNYFKMYQENCVRGIPIEKERFQAGKCSDIDNSSPNPDESEEVPEPTGCDDPNLCVGFPVPPALANGPVCGPESAVHPRTFPSLCEMIREICRSLDVPRTLRLRSTIRAQPGKCGQPPPVKKPEKPSEPIYTRWTEYGSCIFFDEVCGEGVQFRFRNVVPYEDGRLVREIVSTDVNQSRTCFEPCPSSSDNPGNCPDTSFCKDYDPVCGVVGVGAAQEYNSECLLNIDACKKGDQPKVLNQGQCDPDDNGHNGRICEKGPVSLTVKYDKEQDGEHCFGSPFNIDSCGDLLCEGGQHTCCRATEYEKIQIELTCISLDTGDVNPKRSHMYLSATKCACHSKL